MLKLVIDTFKTILKIRSGSVKEIIIGLKAFGIGCGFASASIGGGISVMVSLLRGREIHLQMRISKSNADSQLVPGQ